MLNILVGSQKRALILYIFFFFHLEIGFTTTIIPFSHLGELAREVECVVFVKVERHYEHLEFDKIRFRTLLSVKESLKGDLEIGDLFALQKWKLKIGDLTRFMAGDIELESGKNYLLFLSKRGDIYHPVCFSYYIYEEVIQNDSKFLVPSEGARFYHLTGKEIYEPLYSYPKEALMRHLQDVISTETPWNGRAIKIDFTRPSGYEPRAAPGHCDFLGGNNHIRWLNFPGVDLPVHYQSSGDATCNQALNFIRDAIDTLNAYYTGISIIDGGSISGFVPDCEGTTQGINLPAWINSNLGGSRHVVVQFNDPCDAIPPLNGCSGTLAIGGLYGMGSHTYDGDTWSNGAYGYVVVNNGVGGCMCDMSNYGSMMTHELTHTLGIGHIPASSGTANMNPSCCNPVGDLDQDCLNYVYETSVLPVELSDFSGLALESVNELRWTTESEVNVDKFVLERSEDLGSNSFLPIGELTAKGKEPKGAQYRFTDPVPNGLNYYRLKSFDHDGSSQISKILTIKRDHEPDIQVYPTLTSGKVFIKASAKSEICRVVIMNVRGQIMIDKKGSNSSEAVEINGLPGGIYILRLIYPGGSKQVKIQKI